MGKAPFSEQREGCRFFSLEVESQLVLQTAAEELRQMGVERRQRALGTREKVGESSLDCGGSG